MSSRILWQLSSCYFSGKAQGGHKANEMCRSCLILTVSSYYPFPRRSSYQLNLKEDFSEVWNSQNASASHNLPLFYNLINCSRSPKMAIWSNAVGLTRSETQGIRKGIAYCCSLKSKDCLWPYLVSFTRILTALISVEFLDSIRIFVNDIQICLIWVICD